MGPNSDHSYIPAFEVWNDWTYTWISFPLFSSFHLEKDPTKSQDPVLVDHVYETFNKNLASTQTCVSTVKQKGQNSKLDFQDFGAIRSIIVLLISFQVNSTLWSNYNYILFRLDHYELYVFLFLEVSFMAVEPQIFKNQIVFGACRWKIYTSFLEDWSVQMVNVAVARINNQIWW